MADSVVSFLIENLSQLLAREANLLYGVEDKVRSLHSELKMINVLLEASEGKKKKSKKGIEQEVLSQIGDVAHEAEDVIDTFVAKVAMYRQRTMLGRMLHGVEHAKLLHDVAEKIDKIKATFNDIRDNKIKYDVLEQESESSTTREDEERVRLLHKRRRNVEEVDVVGFAQDSKVVIERLVEGGSRSNVISIVGMGGLGKTTLARKVYNSNEVKEYFDCRAWVYVSNECRLKELLLGLLKCLMPDPGYECRSKKKGKKQKGETEKPRDLSSLSQDELKQKVWDCLKRKRYLVVLDDLWKTQDWDEVQEAFPDDNGGGKILITSRSKEVASHASQDPPHDLQLLKDEESWELFCKRAFRGEECPSDLEPLGKQIIKSCHGLPLSIVVLAGLLANKEKSHRKWSKVVGHVNWYLTQEKTQVKDILKLSYDDLPRRLKPCFLYLGIFPEDFEIPVRQLLQQWVAEGFIQQTGTKDPEDVAEDYLDELIDRSLVQIAQVKRISGGVKTCRIHDLLRDLCIFESKDNKHFEVCTDNNILVRAKPRRLSVHCGMPHYVSSSNSDHSCVRSLFCFGPQYHFTSGEWKWLFKSFKLVRVLDLGNNECRKIPSNLGLFIHLRYIRIRSRYITFIPDSISTLQNLQTLDMTATFDPLISFPSGLLKLKQLRHVYTSGPIMLRGHHSSKSDDEVMWNLQTISCIALNRKTAYLLEKGRFPKLRKLGLQISSDCKGKLRKLLPSLQQLSHLNKLQVTIEWKFKGSVPSNYGLMERHIGCRPHELLQSLQQLTHLNALKIDGALDLPTCPVAFPPCITKLTLDSISCMNDDGMNAMGNLTRLRILRLSGEYGFPFDSFELNCTAGGFPQLQVFEIRELAVHNWKLANGAMPCLQSLVISKCRELDSLPNELWSLTALRQVQVLQPTEALSLMLRNLEMKDGCELIIR